MRAKQVLGYYRLMQSLDEADNGGYDYRDDGAYDVYKILVKLMGDERSMDEISVSGCPSFEALKIAAESGSEEHWNDVVEELKGLDEVGDMDISKYGLTFEISEEIIEKLDDAVGELARNKMGSFRI